RISVCGENRNGGDVFDEMDRDLLLKSWAHMAGTINTQQIIKSIGARSECVCVFIYHYFLIMVING
ncbi:MAG: hypothetical protein JW795_20605, partial [Chitinivibrionales bacterium]|nr:hypothetical protein [Chitinivibrionales bacterium]